MSQMSEYLENVLGNVVLRGAQFSVPAGVYVGLFTSAPDEGGKELAGEGYERREVKFSPPSEAGVFKSSTDVSFPQAKKAWGAITHYAIFDAASGGHLLVWGILADDDGKPEPKTVNAGDIFKFLANDLTVNFL